MDLVAIIKDQFGGDTIAKLAGAAGVDTSSARTAMEAGVPAMLAGLTGVASNGDGARRLAMAVDGADDRTAMNFGQIVSSGGRGLMESGGSLLNNLFGSGTASSLTGVISRFTGVGSNATGSLMAMVAPMILGVLKGRKQEEHLDAGGLANMLQSQKGNIARAMPAGLGNMLSSAMPNFAGTADTVRGAVGTTVDTTRRTAHAAPKAGPKWLVPVLIALAVIGLLWWLIGRGAAHRTVAPTVPQTTPAPTRDVTSPAVSRFTTDVQDIFRSTTDTLGGVTDAASAETAMPALQQMSTRLDTLRQDWNTLPVSARASVGSVVESSSAALTRQLDRVKAIPGVSEGFQRAVDEVSSKVNALGT